MKKLLAALVLVGAAGCAPKFDAATMGLFQGLADSTAQTEQAYRVAWKARIKASLKADADPALVQYLDVHGQALDGLAKTTTSLNDAVKAQQK